MLVSKEVYYIKAADVNIVGILGFGLSRTDLERSIYSNVTGKNLTMGIMLKKNIWGNLEYGTSMFNIMSFKKQTRLSQPDSYQTYLAKSTYRTQNTSLINEIGYVFKIQNGYSFKPSLGLQLSLDRRSGFSEKNLPDRYAQVYKAKIGRSGEIYGGLGVRKKWRFDNYEGKVTAVYQIGQKSGNNRSSETLYTAGSQNSATISSQKAGRTAHYINLYGSILNNKDHWKVSPSVTATLQKRQTSMSYAVKLEYRF
jgi:hypothetical protein